VTDADAQLDELTAELRSAASRLRSGELEPDAAAALIDDCARLAARAAAELEREGRALESPPEQDSLL
jgi:hypothetical protein